MSITSELPVSTAAARAPRRDKEFVQALERGFAVIKAFSGESPSLTMTAVAKRTNLPRAVARRYLFTLATLGFVSEHEGRYALAGYQSALASLIGLQCVALCWAAMHAMRRAGTPAPRQSSQSS